MKKRKLVLSTGNQHKVEEIKNILEGLSIEVVSKKDVGLGELDVVEDGYTLEENSLKKAKALAEKMCFFIESPSQINLMGLESMKMAHQKFDAEKVNNRLFEIMGLNSSYEKIG